MQEALKETIDLFLENREKIKSAYKWESEYIYPLSGLMFTAKHEKIDIERMKEAEKIVKSKTGVFSGFRGSTQMAIMAQMVLSDDMEGFFDAVKRVYDKLSKKKWVSSEYLIVAAMVIVQNEKDESKYDALVENTNDIMERMRKNHPWLTGGEDTGFAALLAVSGLQPDELIEEMEKCYNILQESKKFRDSNGIQSLSHVLALELGNSEEKCNRVIGIYENLKEKNKKFGQTYELSTLGGLTLVDAEISELAEQIAEVDDLLKTHKGFGAWGIGSKQRLMYASMLVMQQYTSKVSTVEAAALSGVVAIIIAEEVAMLAAITASTVAATTTSGN